MSEGGAELRADARRNRERIIAAAEAIFAERGADAPMEEIARGAGVGVGTLYRRFPDRDALVVAVMRTIVARLAAAGRAALAEEPDAWSAFERFLRETTGLHTTTVLTALRPVAVRALTERGELKESRRELFDILDTLVRGAQSEGAMRTDLGTGDVMLLMSGFNRRLPGLPHDLAERTYSRFTEVMLDGLRATPRRPVEGGPLHIAELDAKADQILRSGYQDTGSS